MKNQKPDLVVILGDLANGHVEGSKEKGWYKRKWESVTNILVKYQIRWVYTLGNHDGGGDLSNNEVYDLDKTGKYSCTLQTTLLGPENAYIHQIETHDNSKVFIWVLNSKDWKCLGVERYGCVSPNQVSWIKSKLTDLETKYGSSHMRHIFIQHIPPPQFMNLWNEQNDLVGVKNEPVACPGIHFSCEIIVLKLFHCFFAFS